MGGEGGDYYFSERINAFPTEDKEKPMTNLFYILLIIGLFYLICGNLYSTPQNDIDGVFYYQVGEFEVYTIVEREREGSTSILLNADEDFLSQFIPETGFTHSTNAFLIKTPEKNILVDAGTGAGWTILEKIRQIGVEPEEIDIVLLTHLHFDHFGGLQDEGARNFPNAIVYLSNQEHNHFIVSEARNQAAIDVLALYGENVHTFGGYVLRDTLEEFQPLLNEVPEIFAIQNPGHTPGHTVFLLESEGERLLIAGDFLHLALVQFAHPEISATFDVDPTEAASSRRQLLDFAAKNSIPIGAMHIVYPGIGNVEIDGDGFRFFEISN